MDKFRLWLDTNRVEITWFIIGWLALAGIHELQQGNVFSAFVDVMLIVLNFKLNQR